MSAWTRAWRAGAFVLAGALAFGTAHAISAAGAARLDAPLVVRSSCSFPVRLVTATRDGRSFELVAREPGVYRFAAPELDDAVSVASGAHRRPVQEFPVGARGALLLPPDFCQPIAGGAGVGGGVLGSR